ncbi:hypothetical protein ACF1BQ_028660 [Bradyrhizobium sp. RDT10]
MMIADEDAALFGGAHRALTFLEPASYQQGLFSVAPTPLQKLGRSTLRGSGACSIA